MGIKEFSKKLFSQKYLKMYLVREGNVIETYILGIQEKGWLLDTKKKCAWQIPAEGDLIRDKKCFFWFGSLESHQNFDFREIPLFTKTKKEISIPFLRPKFYPNNWTFEKTKFVIRKRKEISIIDDVKKIYTPVLNALDMGSLYQFLTGAAIELLMESQKEKKKQDWILWILIAGAAIVTIYFVFNKR